MRYIKYQNWKIDLIQGKFYDQNVVQWLTTTSHNSIKYPKMSEK